MVIADSCIEKFQLVCRSENYPDPGAGSRKVSEIEVEAAYGTTAKRQTQQLVGGDTITTIAMEVIDTSTTTTQHLFLDLKKLYPTIRWRQVRNTPCN